MEYTAQSILQATPQEVYDYHGSPGAFARLTPPWERVRLLRSAPLINRELAVLQVPLGPLWATWVAEHHDVEPGRQFCDRQLAGPFAAWDHCHRMEAAPNNQTLLTDQINYTLPLGTMGQLGGGWYTARKLERMFRYRHDITQQDLACHRKAGLPPVNIVITGVTGTIGRSLAAFLLAGGHRVLGLTRGKTDALPWLPLGHWDPDRGELPARYLEGADVVIHLAGANIASERWTQARRQQLVDSRVRSTQLLANTITGLKRPPTVFMAASGAGYYGNTGPELFAEERTPVGQGFLAELAWQWEQASHSLETLGIRRVLLRLGMVLTPAGGLLQKLWWPTMLGGAWPLGSGQQWMSWIALDDVLGAILHSLATPAVAGPVNLVAPQPVRNRELMQALATVCHRPVGPAIPEKIVQGLVGDLAKEGMLADSGVVPKVLEATGYQWLYPDLKDALSHQLGFNSLGDTLAAMAGGG